MRLRLLTAVGIQVYVVSFLCTVILSGSPNLSPLVRKEPPPVADRAMWVDVNAGLAARVRHLW